MDSVKSVLIAIMKHCHATDRVMMCAAMRLHIELFIYRDPKGLPTTKQHPSIGRTELATYSTVLPPWPPLPLEARTATHQERLNVSDLRPGTGANKTEMVITQIIIQTIRYSEPPELSALSS